MFIIIGMSELSVVFHKMESSDAVRARAEDLLRRLQRYSPGIIHSRMVIEARHRHHHHGNLYHVSIMAHSSGLDVEISHDPERDHAHEDVYVAMRDAFRAARKRMLAIQDKRRERPSSIAP